MPGMVELDGLDVEVGGGQGIPRAGFRGLLAAEVDPSTLFCRGSAWNGKKPSSNTRISIYLKYHSIIQCIIISMIQ